MKIMENKLAGTDALKLKGLNVIERLDETQAYLLRIFPGWFVYKGSNHVALHQASGSERVLLVVEETIDNRNPRACRACNNIRGNEETKVAGVYRCRKCLAIFGTCYKGDAFGMVLPWMAKEQIPVDRQRYFDFTMLGSNGISRRHGWYDPETKLMTQVG